METIQKLISEFHTSTPINIERMIEAAGLDLVRKGKLDSEIAGQIERMDSGKYQISVNEDDNYFRRRFTMAHEFSHWMLHRDLIETGVDDTPAYRSTNAGKFFNKSIKPWHETQANQMAAYLLMPDHLVRQAYDEVGENVRELAKIFQVSQQSMGIRLESLGLGLT